MKNFRWCPTVQICLQNGFPKPMHLFNSIFSKSINSQHAAQEWSRSVNLCNILKSSTGLWSLLPLLLDACLGPGVGVGSLVTLGLLLQVLGRHHRQVHAFLGRSGKLLNTHWAGIEKQWIKHIGVVEESCFKPRIWATFQNVAVCCRSLGQAVRRRGNKAHWLWNAEFL